MVVHTENHLYSLVVCKAGGSFSNGHRRMQGGYHSIFPDSDILATLSLPRGISPSWHGHGAANEETIKPTPTNGRLILLLRPLVNLGGICAHPPLSHSKPHHIATPFAPHSLP